jgi:4-amino-4-deoxy-L-arabinose transferase-like glycosyltransferase
MKSVMGLWAFILFVKLTLAALLPLYPDEAYYWFWSHHLQLSYFDHPGLIAWLISLGHPLESFLHSVRWPAVVLGHTALLFWLSLLKSTFTIRQLKLFLVLMTLAPLMGFGTVLLTPDLPLFFFWSASIYFSVRALRDSHLGWYMALGASLGLGFCSKYHIVLYIPWVLAWLSFSRLWPQVKVKGVALTILIGFLFSLPVLIWNYENDFISFLFQYQHGLVRESFQFKWPIEYVVQQSILFLPPLMWVVVRTSLPTDLRFLSSVMWTPLIFFFLTSFKGPVEANWPSLAHPGFLAICAYSSRYIWRRTFIAMWTFVSILLLTQIYSPWIKTGTLSQFTELPRTYLRISQLVKDFQPLWADTYQSAAQLSYYSGRWIYKLRGFNRYDQFDLFAGSLPAVSEFYFLMSRTEFLAELEAINKYEILENHHLFDDYRILKLRKK